MMDLRKRKDYIGDKKRRESEAIQRALRPGMMPPIRGMNSQRRIDMLDAVKKAGYLK
jgi:hypothetical protein